MIEDNDPVDLKAEPMNKGRISLQCFQYARNALDFHLPCTMTMNGSMPKRRRCIVPPILTLWPVSLIGDINDQASLHRSMNQTCFMAVQDLFIDSKAKSGPSSGVLTLMIQWLLKAARGLQGQPESVQRIHSPLGFVLVDGAKKPPYKTPLEVLPYFNRVNFAACRDGLKGVSTHNSINLH